jgi:N-acetylglucosaminyldiphosphoundecaprenol N-acetyl-beta-D-mannosaminyltransferase
LRQLALVHPMPAPRINFLDLNFDPLSFEDLKHRLELVNPATPYGYVVTPNVQHVVEVHSEPKLRKLYDEATYCVCDSRILRLLARLRGIRLPLIAGSDLVETLFTDIIRPGDTVAVIGGTGAFLEHLRGRFPDFQFLHFEPPMGLRSDVEARRSAAEFIVASAARFTFVAVGMPQQEMIACEASELPGAKGIALCVGAALDFLTGGQKRAPNFLQLLHLEWAHRLATNPRRLWRRYLIEGLRIFPIFFRWRGSAPP